MLSIDCDDQFKEEGGEVVKEDLVFFSQGWRRGFNGKCHRE